MKIKLSCYLTFIGLVLNSCGESNEFDNKSVQITIALVNQMECCNQIDYTDCQRIIGKTISRISEEKSMQAPTETIKKLENLKDELMLISGLSQITRNWNIQLASDLIMSTTNADSVNKFNSKNVNSAYSFEDGVREKDRFQLISLMHLTDPLAPNNLEKAQWQQLRVNFKTYRDTLLRIICNYSDFSRGKIVERRIKLDELELISDRTSDQGLFDEQIEKALKNVDRKDQDIAGRLIRLLTLPVQIEIDSKLIKWSKAKFMKTPLIFSCAELLRLNSLIIKSEKIGIELIASKAARHQVGFRKVFIEFVPKKYSLKEGDHLTLSQRLYLEDPIDEIPLRYWVDDSTKMGRVYETYLINSSGKLDLPHIEPGLHTIYGDFQAQDYGAYKWKPFRTSFFVQ